MNFRERSALDPSDWDRYSHTVHELLDELLDRMSGKRDNRWRPVPEDIHKRFLEPLSERHQDLDGAVADIRELVFPYSRGNANPNYYAYVDGPGSAISFLGEMISAGLNPNCTGLDQAATYVEAQTIRWLADILGFPATATGLFVSGATVANLIGLAAARSAALPEAGEFGLRACEPIVYYASREVHKWATKAMQILGVGSANLRLIDVDNRFRIDTSALERSVANDVARGFRPCCVIGSAGTVNTGAIDDLEELRRIATRFGMWFHIDGAIGAIARVSKNIRPLLKGLETADSLAFDLHKWGGQCYEAGVALVAGGPAHQAAFTTDASGAPYLSSMEMAITAVKATNALPRSAHPYTLLGIDQSRSFKALKVWLSLKCFGAGALAQAIDQNCEQAQYLASLIEADERLELCAPVSLNIVCFRYRFAGDGETQDALTLELLNRVQLEGIAVPSSTVLNGRVVVRVALVNHRSTMGDFKTFIEAVTRIADDISMN